MVNVFANDFCKQPCRIQLVGAEKKGQELQKSYVSKQKSNERWAMKVKRRIERKEGIPQWSPHYNTHEIDNGA